MANASEIKIPMAPGIHMVLSSSTSRTGPANTKPKIAIACALESAAACPIFQEPNRITSAPAITATM